MYSFTTVLRINNHDFPGQYRGADKSLARPGRKQATATEDFDFFSSYQLNAHFLYSITIYIHFLHSSVNIEPLYEFIHRLLEKFFHQCSTHHNPLVRQIGDYTTVDLQHRYKKYIHKRTKHVLLQFHPVAAVFFVYCLIVFTAVILLCQTHLLY